MCIENIPKECVSGKFMTLMTLRRNEEFKNIKKGSCFKYYFNNFTNKAFSEIGYGCITMLSTVETIGTAALWLFFCPFQSCRKDITKNLQKRLESSFLTFIWSIFNTTLNPCMGEFVADEKSLRKAFLYKKYYLPKALFYPALLDKREIIVFGRKELEESLKKGGEVINDEVLKISKKRETIIVIDNEIVKTPKDIVIKIDKGRVTKKTKLFIEEELQNFSMKGIDGKSLWKNIEKLPKDCIYEILLFLPSVDIITSARRIKLFNKIIKKEHFIKELIERDVIKKEKLIKNRILEKKELIKKKFIEKKERVIQEKFRIKKEKVNKRYIGRLYEEYSEEEKSEIINKMQKKINRLEAKELNKINKLKNGIQKELEQDIDQLKWKMEEEIEQLENDMKKEVEKEKKSILSFYLKEAFKTDISIRTILLDGAEVKLTKWGAKKIVFSDKSSWDFNEFLKIFIKRRIFKKSNWCRVAKLYIESEKLLKKSSLIQRIGSFFKKIIYSDIAEMEKIGKKLIYFANPDDNLDPIESLEYKFKNSEKPCFYPYDMRTTKLKGKSY